MSEKNKKKALSIRIILMLIVYIGIMTGSTFLLDMEKAWGTIIWFSIVVVGLIIIFTYHSRNVAFICKKCGSRFEITPFKDFLSPHTMKSHYLKCPKCGQRSWKEIVPK